MVDFKKIAGQAKKVIDERGGTDALKEDLNELKDIATGKGSVSDKAKAAAEALKNDAAKTEEPAEEVKASE